MTDVVVSDARCRGEACFLKGAAAQRFGEGEAKCSTGSSGGPSPEQGFGRSRSPCGLTTEQGPVRDKERNDERATRSSEGECWLRCKLWREGTLTLPPARHFTILL